MGLEFRQWASLGFVLSLVLMIPFLTNAQIYKYEDANGVIQFTDDLSKIPKDNRIKAEEESKKVKATSGLSTISSSEKTPEQPPVLDKKSEEKQKEVWQSRLRKAENDLEKAKEELRQTQTAQRKNLETGPGRQKRQAELAEKETKTKEKIEKLEYEIKEGIPTKARKAGVPPGYLR